MNGILVSHEKKKEENYEFSRKIQNHGISFSASPVMAAGKTKLPKGFASTKTPVEMTIFAVKGKKINHVALAFKSQKKIKTKYFTIKAGETVSMATYRSLPRKGAWLNYTVADPGSYVAAATKKISESAFRKAIDTAAKNDTWTNRKTSAWFAATVWNSVGGRRVKVASKIGDAAASIRKVGRQCRDGWLFVVNLGDDGSVRRLTTAKKYKESGKKILSNLNRNGKTALGC